MMRQKTALETARPLLTIGHSTRPLPTFIKLLKAHNVSMIVDIRTIPRSRRNPQFNREILSKALRAEAIEYVHLPALGGLRRPKPDSVNAGWINPSFRGFADYMQTEEFERGITELMNRARPGGSALMCAEAVPWRCHRSLVADKLSVLGIPIEHIVGPARRLGHTLTPWAQVDGTRITYPPQGADRQRRLKGPGVHRDI